MQIIYHCNNCDARLEIEADSAGSRVECPTCHQGEIVERRSKKGRKFYGCERYPECDFVSWNKPIAQPCPGTVSAQSPLASSSSTIDR